MELVQSGTLGWLALLTILTLSGSRGIQAQQEPTQSKPVASTQVKQTNSPQETSPLRNPPAIDIKVETFRKQLVPGDAVGVVADITNNSSKPVFLREQDVQLLFALEVERTGSSTDGWFPTEYREKSPILCLKPGETYRVFWIPPSQSFDLFRWIQFFRFVPGAYPISVETKYWDQAKFDGNDYHTAVADKTVDFAAPESIILLGAMLGGLIFAGLSIIREEEQPPKAGTSPSRLDNASPWVRIPLTLIGSMLLSVIVTILLSRIQETQFFIKVSVSDLWGAVAVGFLANYGGFALLDKMVPAAGKGEANKQPQTPVNPAVKP